MTATGENGGGGALFINNNANVTLQDVSFANNHAIGGSGIGGGGVNGSGGGAAMGGSIFIVQGGTLTIQGNSALSGSSLTAGMGGEDGADGNAFGAGIFLQGNDVGNGGAGMLTFSSAAAQTQTYNDVIADQTGVGGTGTNAGHWSITKSGAGTLTLTGANTYSGGTTITAGTLIGNTTSLTGDISDNAALVFDQATDGTFAGAIIGSGTVTIQGGAAVTYSGANTYNGGTTINNDGSSLIGTTNTVPPGLPTATGITNNSILTFDQSFDGTFAGNIGGSGSITVTGGELLNLRARTTTQVQRPLKSKVR